MKRRKKKPQPQFYADGLEGLTPEDGFDAVTDVALVPEFLHCYLVPDEYLDEPAQMPEEYMGAEADPDDDFDSYADIEEEVPDEIIAEVEEFMAEEPHEWRYQGPDARDYAQFRADIRLAVANCNSERLLQILALYEYQFELAARLKKAIDNGDYVAAKHYLSGITAA